MSLTQTLLCHAAGPRLIHRLLEFSPRITCVLLGASCLHLTRVAISSCRARELTPDSAVQQFLYLAAQPATAPSGSSDLKYVPATREQPFERFLLQGRVGAGTCATTS